MELIRTEFICVCCEKRVTHSELIHKAIVGVRVLCADCVADAALGRAVRRIPDMAKLWHAESRWYLHPGDAPCLPLGTGNSPEAALKAAGLMEVEG